MLKKIFSLISSSNCPTLTNLAITYFTKLVKLANIALLISLIAIQFISLNVANAHNKSKKIHKSQVESQNQTQKTDYSQTDLPEGIKELIAKDKLDKGKISIWFAPLNGEALLKYSENTPKNPASVAKILTTGISLVYLGENYRWKTIFYTDGYIMDKTLNGNLYIKAQGDPYLVEEDMPKIVGAIQDLGIYTITGKVILDNSYYQQDLENPNSFDGKGMEAYNALPSPFSINFRTSKLIFSVADNKAVAKIEPPLSFTKFENAMTLNNNKKCSGKGFAPIISIDRQSEQVLLSGSMSKNCPDIALDKVIADAGDSFYSFFKAAWIAQGGKIADDWHYGIVPENAKPFYVWYSKPLSEQVAPMNKNSNNLMARQIFLTLGAQTGQPASIELSRQVANKLLTSFGVDITQIHMDNGAGLARDTSVTAKQLGIYLQKMSEQSVFATFRESLPIAGNDGTLRKRLRGTPLQDNVVAKTGTLKNVKSIAGYMTTSSGMKTVFVILVEGNRFTSKLQDDILLWLYNRY